jgi:hypothetical protein
MNTTTKCQKGYPKADSKGCMKDDDMKDVPREHFIMAHFQLWTIKKK